ncbi:hypothetical protein SAMD00019534_079800, partial [Acytostelium subglobosum LB1]|uniref:hypothetical protein n=1 Tax=Acytostelium subglobosum LB1 TaxID=1410327 RepID=UPI00064521EB
MNNPLRMSGGSTSSRGSTGSGGSVRRQNSNIGDASVFTTRTANANGYTQTTTRVLPNGEETSYSSTYTYQTGIAPQTTTMLNQSHLMSTQRPQQESGFNSEAWRHPAFNENFTSPTQQLVSRNGQRRRYNPGDFDDLTEAELQEYDSDDEDEYDDDDDDQDVEYEDPIKYDFSKLNFDEIEKQQIREAIRLSAGEDVDPGLYMMDEEAQLQRAINESMRISRLQQHQQHQQQVKSIRRQPGQPSPTGAKPLAKKRVNVRQDLNEYFDDEAPEQRAGDVDDSFELYDNPELRGYLSRNEQTRVQNEQLRMQRQRAIDDSRRIREEQDREVRESLPIHNHWLAGWMACWRPVYFPSYILLPSPINHSTLFGRLQLTHDTADVSFQSFNVDTLHLPHLLMASNPSLSFTCLMDRMFGWPHKRKMSWCMSLDNALRILVTLAPGQIIIVVYISTLLTS